MSEIDFEQMAISQIREGDVAAWKELIARFEGRLLAFVESRLRNRAASEDVVQEAFLGFLISLPNYDERTPLESWLFAITAHKLTDYLRREGRRPVFPLMASDSQGRSAEPAGTARRASSLLQSRERCGTEEKVVAECLRSLIELWTQENQFERLKCIELLFVLGWANKAVAERLGITEQTVANHKYFAVSKLKEAAAAARLRDFQPADLGLS